MTKITTAKWMSWGESLSEQFGEKTAVIQILNPGMQPYQIGAHRELVLSFWDTRELTFGETILARLFGNRPQLCLKLQRMFYGDLGWPWRPPLACDAKRIKDFVDNTPAGWDFIVTCEYGQSRSRAVAEWIAFHRKIKPVGSKTRGTPNILLSDLLFGTTPMFSRRKVK
jgi:hypothetical protein